MSSPINLRALGSATASVGPVTSSPSTILVAKVASAALRSCSKVAHAHALQETLDVKIEAALEGYTPQIIVPMTFIPLATFMEGGAKRLGHIVLDSLVRNSKLEGSTPDQTSGWLLDNLRLFRPTDPLIGTLEAFQKRCQSLLHIYTPSDLDTPVAAYVDEIRHLKESDSFLLPGGWQERPLSHFMLYEIRKNASGTFTFNVYNSGAGSDTFHDLIYEKGKQLIRPLISFQDIPEDILLAESGKMIRMLLEIGSTSRTLSPTQNADLIYDIILAVLHPFHKPGVVAEFGTPQRSGTCAYSGLIAFLRSYMPLKDFKTFQIHSKVAELIKAFTSISNLAENSEAGRAARYLLKQGSKWVMSRLLKAYKTPASTTLSPKELLQYMSNVRALSSLVQKSIESAGKTPYFPLPPPNTTLFTATEITPYTPPPPLISKEEVPSPLPLARKITTLEGMRLRLTHILTLMQKETISELERSYVVSFIKSLPEPADLSSWELAVKDLELLYALQEAIFLKGQYLGTTVSFDEKLAQLKLYALIHATALFLDQKCQEESTTTIKSTKLTGSAITLKYAFLDRYSCGFINHKSVSFCLGFNATNLTGEKEKQALLAYFTRCNEGKESAAIFFNEAEGSYWDLILSNDIALRYAAQEAARHIFRSGEDFSQYIVRECALNSSLKLPRGGIDMESAGLSHLYILRKSAFATYLALECLTNSRYEALITPLTSKPCLKISGVFSNTPYNNCHFSSDTVRILEGFAFTSDEYDLLDKARIEGKTPLKKELLRASKSKESSWHLLLRALQENITFLEDQEIRQLFNALFFDSTKFRELISDKTIATYCENFIQKGLKTFFLSRLTKPAWHELLFILDFATRTRIIQTKSSLATVGSGVDDILALLIKNSSHYDEMPKGALAFLTELYLRSLLFKETPSVNSIQVLATWIFFTHLESLDDEEYTRPASRTLLINKVHETLEHIDEELHEMLAESQSKFMHELYEALSLPLPEGGEVTYTYPLTLSFTKGRESYKAILSSGYVTSPMGLLQGTDVPHWIKAPLFQQIFGKEVPRFIKTSQGYVFSFTHMTGTFLITATGPFLKETNIYCTFTGHGITLYQKPEALASLLPSCLVYDHNHFSLPDGSFVIADKKTNTPCYLLILQEKPKALRRRLLDDDDEENIYYIEDLNEPGSRTASFEEEAAYNRAELPDFTLTTYKENKLIKMAYPRLHVGGKEVVFSGAPRLIASFDTRFYLSSDAPPFLLEGFTGFLLLKPLKEGKDRALIPIFPFAKTDWPTSEIQLDPSLPEEGGTPTYTLQTEKTIPAILFTIEEGMLKSENNAGLLYLAYLHLQSKNYETALSYLQEFNFAEALGETEALLLNFFSSHQDKSPQSAALMLKIALLAHAYKKSMPSLDEALDIYFNGLDKVDAFLKLALHELQVLAESSQHSLLLFWIDEIRGYKHTALKDRSPSFISDNIHYGLSAEENVFFDQALRYASMSDDSRDIVAKTFWNSLWFNEFFPQEEVKRDFWLTKLGRDDWPRFPTLYNWARQGSPIQKKLFAAQMRSYLLVEQKNPLPIEKRLFLKLIYQIAITPDALSIYPEIPALPLTKEGPDIEHITRFLKNFFLTAPKPKGAESVSQRLTITSKPSTPQSPRSHYMPLHLQVAKLPRHLHLADRTQDLTTFATDFFTSSVKARAYTEALPDIERTSLSSEEELYKKPVTHSLQDFCKEIAEGQRLLRERPVYALKEGTTVSSIQDFLLKKKEALEVEERKLVKLILDLANKTGPSHETLELGTSRRKALSLETLYYLFLQQNPLVYERENNNLTKDDIAQIENLLFNHLLIKTTLQHIDRALRALEEPSEENIQLVSSLLSQKRAYDPLKAPHYLVFEYFSDIRLYPKQLKLLEDLQETGADGHVISQVGQLMMGGGKTKVISALLLFASTRPEHLAVLMVPSSLYTIVYADLNASFKQNFARVVHPIQFTREDLTEAYLISLETQLLRAMAIGQVILIKSEALQTLRLQFVFEFEEALLNEANFSKKGIYLSRILHLLRERSDILIDEVHLVLAQKQEVNFPVGIEKLVASAYIDLICALFLSLATNPELKEALEKDIQGLLSATLFQAKFMPQIANSLIKSMDLPSHAITEEEALCYVLKQPGHEKIEEKLEALYTNLTTRDIPNKLALLSYILNDLLLKNFKKSCGRHFGPLPQAMAESRHMPTGKIVPYHAVGTPATTFFASWVEETLFGFMTSFRQKVSLEILRQVVKTFKEMSLTAELIAAMNNTMRKITQTDEHPGFTLFDLDEEKMIEEALTRINSDIQRRLLFQAEFLKLTVVYHDERISSNPQDLDVPSLRGLSGTPYNRLCYTKGLSDKLSADPAVEGQIVAALLKKEPRLHIAPAVEAKELLTSLLAETPPERLTRIHGLQDPAGLFKEQENHEIALGFNSVIQEKGLDLTGTLFFWKKPGMSSADQLAFLPIGNKQPLEIKGSSRKALGEMGIDPDKVFIYYDERRCTGTDLPQPQDSINFVTLDNKLDITTVLQSILRLRQFVTGAQEVAFVIPDVLAAQMPNTVRELILHFVKNLSIDQSKQLYQALKQRVDAIFKEAVMEKLLLIRPGEEDSSLDAYEQLRVFYVEKTTSDPFISYGKTPVLRDPLLCLKDYIASKKALLEGYDDEAFKTKIAEKLAVLLASITESKKDSLPEKVPSPFHREEGVEVELAVQAEVAQENEIMNEVEIDQELQRLFHFAQTITAYNETESPFPYEELNKSAAHREEGLNCTLATHFSSSFLYKHGVCFSSSLLVSPGFIIPHLPFCHKSHKPGYQILVEKDKKGALRFMLISRAESDLLKVHLKDLTHKEKFWLIDDRGALLAPLALGQDSLSEDPSLQSALIEIAFFNGNVPYLLEHEEATKAYLASGHTLLKKEILALKAQTNKDYAHLLRKSAQLNPSYVKKETRARIRPRAGLAPLPPALKVIAAPATSKAPSIAPTTSPPVPSLSTTPSTTPITASPSLSPPPDKTLSLPYRILKGTLSLFALPFALIPLLLTLPFSRKPFREFWRWFLKPFV